ncbi:pentatricopeptide repeat-containing protein At1g19720 [Typha angustifolia]|uniref:pentatricopeptide repeat-containing protein At1g19720 n=1 Tax=Typha angustifolia TaxID=59011 RepID=UPI003C2F2E61
MDSPLSPCKAKLSSLNLFIKHISPPQIPSKSIQATFYFAQNCSPNPSKQPPPKPHRSIDRQLNHLCRNGKLQEAIFALEQVPRARARTYISLLQSCIDTDSIEQGRRLHSSIASVEETNPFVETKLVSMYAKCGSLEDARRVFDGMRERNLFTWSALIGGCAREQRWEEIVDLFFHMMHEGVVPDRFLLTKILQSCAKTSDVETGKLLHSFAVRRGFLGPSEENHVSNSILAMYAKSGELSSAKRFFLKMGIKDVVSWNLIIWAHCQYNERNEALRLFDLMRVGGVEPGVVTWNILITSYSKLGDLTVAMELMNQMENSGIAPDVFTWTSMISGFAQNKRESEALKLFQKMRLSGLEPNGVTIAMAISACASLKYLIGGMELHSYAVKMGNAESVLVGNSLIDMYAKCGILENAQGVFEKIGEKDVFSWNSMIGGYTQIGYCGKAYELFSKMESLGVRRNVVTWNVMISGYIKNGDEDQAMELFRRMEADGVKRNTASWNTLIAGSQQNGRVNKALRLFRQMQLVSMRPNSVTILSIIPACGNLIAAWKVREIHACILRNGLQNDVSIANALIDTYAKSGNIISAQAVFDALQSRDLISWNSIIAACVLHGYSSLAQELFHQMKQECIQPDHATFASMINAYSLDGMVAEGRDLFSIMITEYQLIPALEHYTRMVDLYGRSGRLREAFDLIENMPITPDSTVWDAFFTAARIYGNSRLAHLAAENLFKLEPKDPIIRRLHVNVGDMSQVRKPKKERKLDDSHGCCWIEVRNKVYSFLTGVNVDVETAVSELQVVTADPKLMLPVACDSWLEFEEDKEEVAGIHSEKLAIAFGIINSPSFRSMHLIKSVRICSHCHTFAKSVSKLHRREILIKDPKCLHRFKDGKCSCRDFW